MNYNFKDYSKHYIKLESDGTDIVPEIIGSGICSEDVDFYFGEVYPSRDKENKEENFAKESFINYGIKYLEKYVNEVNEKYSTLYNTWTIADETTNKAEKFSKIFSLITILTVVAAFVLTFI